MLTIRFNRVGKKNKAQFKIALQEHTIAPGGAHVEILGSYDPHTKKSILKEDRIKHWISKGAQPSDTVHNLLVKQGIIGGDKRRVKMPAKKNEEAPVEAVPAEAPKVKLATAEAPTSEEPKSEEKKEKKPAEAAPVDKA